MTTIAYHHESKTIAYDSRRTSGNLIRTDEAEKSFDIGDSTFILCGQTSDIVRFKRDFPDFSGEYDISGIMSENGVAYIVYFAGDKYVEEIINYNDAVGSGTDHAVTAMDCGLNAVQAIEMAAMRDTYTGGEIKVIKL